MSNGDNAVKMGSRNEMISVPGFDWVVTGQDEEGQWWVGAGGRKVGSLEMASRMSSQTTAERLATKMGGLAVKVG